MNGFRAAIGLLVLLSFFIPVNLHAEDAETAARRGTRLYEEGKYDEAADAFRRARELAEKNGGPAAALDYNLGTTYARRGDFDRALQTLQSAAGAPEPEDTPEVREQALYNLGVSAARKADTFRRQGETALNSEYETLQQAVSAFRQSLILNPGDDQARHNYALTRRRLKEIEAKLRQQQQQQGGQNQQEESREQRQQQENQQQQKSGQQQTGGESQPDPSAESQAGGSPPESPNQNQTGETRQEPSPGSDSRRHPEDAQPEPPEKSGESGERQQRQTPPEDRQAAPRENEAPRDSGDQDDRKPERGKQTQRGGLEATPEPPPERTPGPAQRPSAGERQSGADASKAQPGSPSGAGSADELTPEQLDALRVLNSLEEGHPDQFKQLFRFRGGEGRDLERDW